MANGDIAASIGWLVVAATDDKRKGYDDINYTRDRAADHVKNGTHPWTSITGRWTHARDIPTNGSNVQADIDNQDTKSNQAIATANNASNVANMARRGDMDIAVWDRQLTTNYRALWMSNTGQVLLGYVPSTRDAKTDIQAPDWDPAMIRAIPVILFRYRAAIASEGPDAQLRVGSLADDLDEMGLYEFVEYGDDGDPVGIRYDLLSLAALWLAQHEAVRLDELELRLARLEGH